MNSSHKDLLILIGFISAFIFLPFIAFPALGLYLGYKYLNPTPRKYKIKPGMAGKQLNPHYKEDR